MEKYFVTASILNLRSSPSTTDNNNILTRLNNKEVLEVEDASNPDWYKVNCINRKPTIEGFAASRYLQKLNGDVTDTVNTIQAVNLKPNSSSRRNNHGGFQYPLSEPDMPRITSNTSNKVDVMHQIVSWLAVDKSARYQREPGKTYCNIYAFDYCYLTNAYLPRVWWTDRSLLKLQQGQALEAIYGVTVDEINANGLFRWLNEWGDDFGWTRTYDLTELQSKVNEGRTGIICGSNINPTHSGHICCVIPETNNITALRRDNKVICPLTSQAGLSNFQLNTDARFRDYEWWRFNSIGHFGFWYCEKMFR